MSIRRFTVLLCALGLVAGAAPSASAHGLIGQRFFPATLAIDDPFVADELSLPTVLHIRNRGLRRRARPTLQTDLSGELSKRLSPNLGLSLGGTYTFLDPIPGESTSGFDNMEVSLKYVFWQNPEHETAGLGRRRLGRGGHREQEDRRGVVRHRDPTALLRQGLRRSARQRSTGSGRRAHRRLRPRIPTRRFNKTIETLEDDGTVTIERELNPRSSTWGFSVQYNLQYLQSFVRDVGLPQPFNRMIPIVEFAMETPIEGPQPAAPPARSIRASSGSAATSSSASRR